MIHNEKSVLSHCILKSRKLFPQEGQQEKCNDAVHNPLHEKSWDGGECGGQFRVEYNSCKSVCRHHPET